LYDISSRLIVKPASAATKRGLIKPIIEQLREAVERREVSVS
jgi:ATP phosphoribosyltransferase